MEPSPIHQDAASNPPELEPDNPEFAPRPGRLAYLLPILLVIGGVLVWAILAGYPAFRAWRSAATAPSIAVVSYEAQRAELVGAGLHQLLLVAQQECPSTGSILALSVDVRPTGQGNYEVYPRTIDIIADTDPPIADELAAHAGGCILYYGPADTVGAKLAPFLSHLTQLACSSDGCLYRINN